MQVQICSWILATLADSDMLNELLSGITNSTDKLRDVGYYLCESCSARNISSFFVWQTDALLFKITLNKFDIILFLV